MKKLRVNPLQQTNIIDLLDSDDFLVLVEPHMLHNHIITDKASIAEIDENVRNMERLAKSMPFVIYYTFEDFVLPGQEQRTHWAKKETCPLALAEAIIVNSTALRLVSNFYLLVDKPTRPTKFFNKVEDAKDWLRRFL